MSRIGTCSVLLAAAATSGCTVAADSASPAASTSAAEWSAVPSSAAASSAPSWADWDEPDDYRFTVESSCSSAFLGVYRVTVRDGEVVAADHDDPYIGSTGVALGPDELGVVVTLGDMLDEALRATGDPEAGKIEVVTDPADGHPTSVSVDHIEMGQDDASCYVVTDYEPGG